MNIIDDRESDFMKKLIIGMLFVTLCFTTGCGCDKEKDEKKENEAPKAEQNTNKDVIKDQTVEGLKLTNTSLVNLGGISTLETEVSNKTGASVFLKSFDIIVKDKKGKEVVTLLGYVGEEIPDGTTRRITTSVDQDLSDAGAISYKINR